MLPQVERDLCFKPTKLPKHMHYGDAIFQSLLTMCNPPIQLLNHSLNSIKGSPYPYMHTQVCKYYWVMHQTETYNIPNACRSMLWQTKHKSFTAQCRVATMLIHPHIVTCTSAS